MRIKSVFIEKIELTCKHLWKSKTFFMCEKFKFWSKIDFFLGKIDFFVKNINFGQKIVILVKNRNFSQKSKFWSKIVIFVKNVNFCEKSNFLSKFQFWWKIEILAKIGLSAYFFIEVTCAKQDLHSGKKQMKYINK